jgi:hypothetical protein
MKGKFGFSYDLADTGKGQGRFIYGKKALTFETLHVCNPIGDLLKSMVSMVQEPSYLWGEESKRVVEWYSESFVYVLEFSTRNGKTIEFSLTRSASVFGEGKAVVTIKGKAPLQEFYHIMVTALDTFIKKIGLLNYAQVWQKDEFPLTYFLILKKYLILWKIWKASKEESDVLESEFMMVLS